MAQGAPEAVKAPHDHGVAGTRLIEELGELAALIQRPGRPVGEDPIAPRRLESVGLETRILLQLGDPGVSQQVPHVGDRIRIGKARTV